MDYLARSGRLLTVGTGGPSDCDDRALPQIYARDGTEEDCDRVNGL